MLLKIQSIFLTSSVHCHMFFYRGKINSRSAFSQGISMREEEPHALGLGAVWLGVVLLGAFESCNGHRT